LGLAGAIISGCAHAKPTSASSEFTAQVRRNFAAWDKNRDGVLQTEELDAVAANPRTTGKAAATVAVLKRITRSSKYKAPALTLKNIEDLVAHSPGAAAPSDPRDIVETVDPRGRPNLPKMYAEGLARIANASRGELFPSGPPQLDTIHQGKLGNCFCIAPVGAMLHRDPRQVAAMFAPQRDGNCRVTLGTHSFVVTPPTDAELAMTSSNECHSVWLNLYEKAVGQARVKGLIVPKAETSDVTGVNTEVTSQKSETKPLGSLSPIDALARGGSAGTMLAFITGHEITRFSFKFAKDSSTTPAVRETKLADLRKQLTAAVRENRLMTCGTIKPTTPGVTPNHAYAVLGYDPATDAVTLWNPHGSSFTPKGPAGLAHGYPEKDGVLTLPLTDWVQQFSGAAFEVTEATAATAASK
ncbi:MAG TPA: hypothetical protein VI454_04615, partial [Verrucomicrobiae bacterium]